MQEYLSGYLLNALDAETERRVEQYLVDNPHARLRMEQLKRTVELLAADKEIEPPANLRYETLARIAEYRCRTLPQAPSPSPSQRSAGRSWWRRADIAVAACLLLLIGGIGVAYLYRVWSTANQVACQQNLSQFYVALRSYADYHDDKLPKISAQPPGNVAGIFVVMIPDTDFSVTCPANGKRHRSNLSFDEVEQMQTDHPDEFQNVARSLSGCYAYSLGYTVRVGDQDCHCGLTMDAGDNTPIMADRPPIDGNRGDSFGNSLNHNGKGQNVLFLGGNVRFCTETVVNGDDIFHNSRGFVAAGEGRDDTVLGVSNAIPYPPDDH
jgi:hypothetical protein